MLVVEDSAIIAMDLEYSLEDMGVAEVTIASDLDTALRVADSGEIDAALIDVFLDRDDGLVVAGLLAVQEIPFALMTGLGETSGLETQFPGVPILAKPFSTEELAKAVERLCGPVSPEKRSS